MWHLFEYTIQDEQILKSYNPKWLILRIIYCVLSLLYDLAILALYVIKPNGVFGYVALFSYWGVTFSIITNIHVLISDITRVHLFYNNPSLLKVPTDYDDADIPLAVRVNWILNVNDTLRDGWIVVSILLTIISSASFWIFIPFDWSLGFSTISSHSVTLIKNVILFFICIVTMHWWSLILIFCLDALYYCFCILLYYIYPGFWIYDIQNPQLFPRWWLLVFITLLGQTGTYIVLCVLNPIKNKIYVWIVHKDCMASIIYQKIVFEIRRREHIRHEILIAVLTVFVMEFWNMAVVIWCFLLELGLDVGLFATQVGLEVLFWIVGLVSIWFGFVFVIQKDEDVLIYARIFNVISIMISSAKVLWGFAGFFYFLNSDPMWVYFASILFGLTSVLVRSILEYFLSLAVGLSTQKNPIISKNFFIVQPENNMAFLDEDGYTRVNLFEVDYTQGLLDIDSDDEQPMKKTKYETLDSPDLGDLDDSEENTFYSWSVFPFGRVVETKKLKSEIDTIEHDLKEPILNQSHYMSLEDELSKKKNRLAFLEEASNPTNYKAFQFDAEKLKSEVEALGDEINECEKEIPNGQMEWMYIQEKINECRERKELIQSILKLSDKLTKQFNKMDDANDDSISQGLSKLENLLAKYTETH